MFLGFLPTSKAGMAPKGPWYQTLEQMLAKRRLRLACRPGRQAFLLLSIRQPKMHLGLQLDIRCRTSHRMQQGCPCSLPTYREGQSGLLCLPRLLLLPTRLLGSLLLQLQLWSRQNLSSYRTNRMRRATNLLQRSPMRFVFSW